MTYFLNYITTLFHWHAKFSKKTMFKPTVELTVLKLCTLRSKNDLIWNNLPISFRCLSFGNHFNSYRYSCWPVHSIVVQAVT